MRRFACVACVIVHLGHAGVARAQAETSPPGATAAATGDEVAKTKFAAALKLYNGAQFEQAHALFRELVAATGSPNARLYVGLCLEQMGRTIDAYNELLRTAKEASLRPESKYDRTREAALVEISLLDARVGKLIVTLLDSPPGAIVVVDGRKLDEREIGLQVVVDAGTHRVEAAAPGRTSVLRDVRIDSGDARTITLALGSADTSRPPLERASGTPFVRIAGYGFAGAAIAGFSMFAIGGLWARSKYGSLEDACGNSHCTDPRHQSDVDEGKALQSVANVGLAIGIVGGALGATFLLVSSRDDHPALSAEARPGGGYVRYRLRF
jgi:hypothetical protein